MMRDVTGNDVGGAGAGEETQRKLSLELRCDVVVKTHLGLTCWSKVQSPVIFGNKEALI
jgi:hypothetical protein